MLTLLLGFDAFDPFRFEHLSDTGRLPHLTGYRDLGGFARLTVASPPQTEVSWTSIATGLDAGGHGIFDFVHRDPTTYTPYVSILPTKRSLFGTRFCPPVSARTLFDEVAEQGYPSVALWWPATFPAQPSSLVRTIPGLGTPDIQGRLGVGTLLSADPELGEGKEKTAFEVLRSRGRDRLAGVLRGPASKKRGGVEACTVEVQIEPHSDESARVSVGAESLELVQGQWSPLLEIRFRVRRFVTVRALTRLILTQVRPATTLYALPLQIHPLHAPWPYASPRSFVKQVWREGGPFLTLGWPQDTTALEEGCISDEQFLTLCDSIFEQRRRVLLQQLAQTREGLIASIFDSLDRIQHMFWRDRPDIVDRWYTKLDALVADVEQRAAELGEDPARIFVLSDHGFSEYTYQVHLNQWLMDQGYLETDGHGMSRGLRAVDWERSQVYAVGLNSLYLNLTGREGWGCVPPEAREPLLEKVRHDLLHWGGPDGRSVVQAVRSQEEAFSGPYASRGPDLVVGYSPGYRASAETGLGQWGETSIERNEGHWGADHCIDAQAVPGVVFANRDIRETAQPSYRDMPPLIVGAELGPSDTAPPPSYSDEEQEMVEERLRSLGYL
jgi:predicted AlkP superfamily phosphohydrolase/phosphomutase